jgi:hypothetical protein
MIKWLHHLLNPHCQECRLERECASCETLRILLEQERHEKSQLLKMIIELNKPPTDAPMNTEELGPIRPKLMPWRVRQQYLEEEDRKKAQILREKTAELEKETGIK